LTHDGAIWVVRNLCNDPNLDLFGKIIIGNNVFVGNSTIILPDISIGDNVIIATGTVVTKNIESGVIVAGNPARTIGSVTDYQERKLNKCLKTKTMKGDERNKFIQHYYGL